MKLNRKEIVVETNATTKIHQFTINTEDAIVFEILRKNMYSDPVGAVVREISTNARDANAEVGKAHIPISITLPSRNYPYLVIKDCGPGISPERMKNFYSSYGASTKRDTNDQIGAWGLGSKTPFCLTDQYIITSYIDGLKYEYTCYIDETGRGAIAEEDPVPTTEPNGTAIRIPISEDKFSECKQKALFYTEFWPVQPVFPGQFDSRKPPKILMQGEGWKLFDSQGSYSNRPRLILAGIPYAVDDKIWFERPPGTSSYYSYDIARYIPNGFCFDLKTGDVSISSNREKIFEDDDTKAKLKAIWKSFKKEYIADYEKQLTGKDLFEGIEFVQGLLSGHQEYFKSILNDTAKIKGCTVEELKDYVEVDFSGEKYYYSDNAKYSMLPTKSEIVLIDAKELNSNVKSKCTRFLRENKITKAVLVLTDTPIGKAVIEHWAAKPDAKIYDLGATKLGTAKTQKAFIYYYDSPTGYAKKLILDDIKSTDKFVYLEWSNLRPNLSNKEFVPLGYQLVVMKPTYVAKIKTNPQFITLLDFMKVWHDKTFSKKKSLELLASNKNINCLDSATKRKLSILSPSSFKAIADAEKFIRTEDSKLELLNYMANHYYNTEYSKATQNSSTVIDKLTTLVYDESRKFPLIQHLRAYDDITPYKVYVDSVKNCNRSVLLSDFIKTI